LKSKNYLDLTTGKKFHPQKDVIILNDPDNQDFYKLRDINSFWHITNARAKEQEQPASTNVRHSVTATRIMEQIQKEKKKRASTESTTTSSATTSSTLPNKKKLKIFSTDVTGIQYTSGKASGSLTSTAMDVASDNTAREADPEEILQVQFQAMRNNKKKGYVQLFTNRGEILLELHCDIVPRTCTNFLGLCEANKYQNTTCRWRRGEHGKCGAGDQQATILHDLQVLCPFGSQTFHFWKGSQGNGSGPRTGKNADR
jgi:peptidyl-prolyl cis-trans isomerase-like protein 2